jgi:hypothetical protein
VKLLKLKAKDIKMYRTRQLLCSIHKKHVIPGRNLILQQILQLLGVMFEEEHKPKIQKRFEIYISVGVKNFL